MAALHRPYWGRRYSVGASIAAVLVTALVAALIGSCAAPPAGTPVSTATLGPAFTAARTATAVATSTPTLPATPTASDASPTNPSPTAAVATPSPSASAPPIGWTDPMRVGGGGTFGLSIAVDPSGHPHIATTYAVGVVHRTDASGSWTVEDIAPFADPNGYGSPDISIDGDGSMAIAYDELVNWGEMGYYNSGTFVTTNGGGGWSDPILVQDDGAFPSLALRDGTVHVAFGTSLGGAFDIECDPDSGLPLRYATVRGESVSSEVIAPDGGGADLALASDGGPRVLFRAGCGNEDLYADGSSGTFDVQPIPLGEHDRAGDMAIGADGTMHLLFYRTVDGTTSVGYIALTDEGWTAPELISTGDQAAMAVDGRGGIDVVLANGDALRYVVGQDQQFVIAPQPISQIASADVVDLALDVGPDGRPHVAYTADGPHNGVYYVVGPGY
jgi:hypothetical protein